MLNERYSGSRRMECFWRPHGPGLLCNWIVADAERQSGQSAKKSAITGPQKIAASRFFFIPHHIVERRLPHS